MATVPHAHTGAQALFQSSQSRQLTHSTPDDTGAASRRRAAVTAERRRRLKLAGATLDIALTRLGYTAAEQTVVRRLHNRSNAAGIATTTGKKLARELPKRTKGRMSAGQANRLLRQCCEQSEQTTVPIMVQVSAGYIAESGEIVDSVYRFPALEIIADAAVETRPATYEAQVALVKLVLDTHWPSWRERVDVPEETPPRPTESGAIVKAFHTHGGNLVKTVAKMRGDAHGAVLADSVAGFAVEIFDELLTIPGIEEYARNKFGTQNLENVTAETFSTQHVADTPLCVQRTYPPIEEVKSSSEKCTHLSIPLRDSGGGLTIDFCTPHGKGVIESEHPPLPSASGLFDGSEVEVETCVAEALAAVDVFERAGCDAFAWFLIDEPAKAIGAKFCKGSSGKGRRLSADELRAALPRLVAATYAHPWSLFVRPYGPGAQLDDVPALDTLPGTFSEIETSRGSWQRWLAIDGADERQARRIGRKVAAKIGADKSASGSVRWPGSRNNKAGREGYTVRLYAVANHVPVTVAQLVADGLLDAEDERPAAPRPLSLPRVSETNHVPAERRGWPSWDRCLTQHGGDSFRADGQWCVLALDRGHTDDDVAEMLLRVREKTGTKATMEYARSVVSGANDYIRENNT